jgi:hypothetical protein
MQRKAPPRGNTKRLVRRSSRPGAGRRLSVASKKGPAKKVKAKPRAKGPRADNAKLPAVTTYTYSPVSLCRMLDGTPDQGMTLHYNSVERISSVLEGVASRRKKRG